MDEPGYKLEELATAAGVSPRTVRYYVQRGLLPPPVFRGRDTVYGAEHLAALKQIKTLQAAWLPLDAIAKTLAQQAIADHPIPVAALPRAPDAATRWLRHVVAPGLEVHVAEDAAPEVRQLAQGWLVAAQALPKGDDDA